MDFPSWCGDSHGCHDHLMHALAGTCERLDRLEEKIMSALTDLQAADEALKAEVSTFLTDIAGRLGTVDDASAEAVVADIQAEVAALQAADPAAAAAAPPAGGSAAPGA